MCAGCPQNDVYSFLNNTNFYNEKLISAKKGFTVQIGETTLHSRYDPDAEAEKYINSLKLKQYKYFILLEPGLNYLAVYLGSKFPMSQVISLHCSSFFDKSNKYLPDTANIFLFHGELSWNPSSAETLEDFLERILFDTDASDIKLIDWKPSVNAYGKACLDLTSVTVNLIKRIGAGRKTVQNFGKRWLKNALNNIELINKITLVNRGSMQILVCAAGPSLEDSINDIIKWKKESSRLLIIAVSSAAPALFYNGIRPDIIITTDGGSWAGFHLIECLRENNKTSSEKPFIAAALTAELPSHFEDYPVIVLRDGSLWQDIVLQAAGYLSLAFPQRGTVSVSALDLAFYLSSGNVYVCGMDLSHRDLLTHARPYAFEKFQEQKQHRKNPLYSQVFERENMIQCSGSHGIYASWFTGHISLFSGRLYSVGNSKFGIPAGKPVINNSGTKANFTVQNAQNKISKKSLIDILCNSLENPLINEQLGKELGELLLHDTSPEIINYTGKIKKALLELADG
ncbi:MAG: DUF115 domain-containing protein [Treponema sp.]|nr:DUF115 domain-containing protein [Treponema sp.]